MQSDDQPQALTGGPSFGGILRGLLAGITALAFAAALVARLATPLIEDGTSTLPSPMSFDAIYTAFTLAWQTRALGSDPSQIAQAPQYFPTPDALFYGPLATGLLPIFAPVFLTTGNPALATNIAYLGSLVLTGAAVHLVVRAWTGSWLAGAIASEVLFLGSFPHETSLAPQWAAFAALPLLIFAADRMRSWRGVLAVGALAAIQAATEIIYVAPMVFVSLGMWALLWCLRRSTRPAAIRLLVASGVAVLFLAPILAGYARIVIANPHLSEQTVWRAGAWSFGTLRDFVLAVPWLRSAATSFVLSFVLSFVAIGFGLRSRPSPSGIPSAAWLGAGLFVAAPGSAMLLLLAIQMFFPSPVVVRAPHRWLLAPMVSYALLVGLTTGAMLTCRTARRFARITSLAVIGIALWLAFAIPASTHRGVPAPWLNPPHGPDMALLTIRSGPLLEVPFTTEPHANSLALYRAIFHRRPILNGYASYWPAEYLRRIELVERLPADPSALVSLVNETGVSDILVWNLALGPKGAPWKKAFEHPPSGLRPVYKAWNYMLFLVEPSALGLQAPTFASAPPPRPEGKSLRPPDHGLNH